MVDASVGMVRIQNNSNSTDAILASYRFKSCPDYTALIAGHKLRSLTQQSVVIMWIDRTDTLVIPWLTAWKDKQI